MSTDRDKALSTGERIAAELNWMDLRTLAPKALATKIDTALAEVRRETWEAAIKIIDAAGEEWGDQARARKSKTYSAYVIAALDLKGRFEVAESAKEKDAKV